MCYWRMQRTIMVSFAPPGSTTTWATSEQEIPATCIIYWNRVFQVFWRRMIWAPRLIICSKFTTEKLHTKDPGLSRKRTKASLLIRTTGYSILGIKGMDIAPPDLVHYNNIVLSHPVHMVLSSVSFLKRSSDWASLDLWRSMFTTRT